jgi:uncharacterized protein DUF1206
VPVSVAHGEGVGMPASIANHRTGRSRGWTGALQTILAQPFERFLLTAVALGFVAFGLFAILQSRYRRM